MLVESRPRQGFFVRALGPRELADVYGIRAVLDPAAMRSNLDGILERARELHPDVAIVIIGMEAPPNLGADYGARFRAVFTDLARQYDAALVPFLLDGVAADPALLHEVLCVQEERIVARDNTVAYDGLKLQLPPSPARAPSGSV